MEGEECFLAVPCAVYVVQEAAQRGHGNIGNAFAVEIVNGQRGTGILHVFNKKFAANDPGFVFDDCVALGNDLFPLGPFRIAAGHFEYTIARRVFVGGEIKLSIKNLATIEKILATGDGEEFAVGIGSILQVKLALGPAFSHFHQQPFAIIGEINVGPVLRVESFAEDERVLEAVCIFHAAQLMKEDMTVIQFLPGRHVAGARIAGVIEAGTVGQPGQAGATRPFNTLRQQFPGSGLYDFQGADL